MSAAEQADLLKRLKALKKKSKREALIKSLVTTQVHNKNLPYLDLFRREIRRALDMDELERECAEEVAGPNEKVVCTTGMTC